MSFSSLTLIIEFTIKAIGLEALGVCEIKLFYHKLSGF